MTPPAPLRILCLVPDQNSPGKHDVTGAFLPEARAFARHYGIDPVHVVRGFPAAASLQVRREACITTLRRASELDVLAFFCHGWAHGIQAGFQRSSILALANGLVKHAKPDAHVLLFACDTARDSDPDRADDIIAGPGGDGGFADELRDACEAIGRRVTVVGHSSAGHCTMNPYARAFRPGQSGAGGEWYVEPKSPLWRRWDRVLHDPRSTLRLRFWSMTPQEIASELEGNGSLVS